jgi:hypothetical protein
MGGICFCTAQAGQEHEHVLQLLLMCSRASNLASSFEKQAHGSTNHVFPDFIQQILITYTARLSTRQL